MKYQKIVKANFLSRPNRFVAKVILDGKETDVHVKNTGRCRELLVPGAVVYLEDFSGRQGKRKLLYDIIAVEKDGLLINMDSQAPNKVTGEALENGSLKLPGMDGLVMIRPETVWGSSRFDFYIEDKNGQKGFLEVKGVTLEHEKTVSFPDAPTERGVKHLRELIKAAESGYKAYVLFVVQMEGAERFVPNDETHREFGDTLRLAAKKGVNILVRECFTAPDTLILTGPISSEKVQIGTEIDKNNVR